MTFAQEMGHTVMRFPGCSGFIVAWKSLPFVGGMGEVFRCKDGSGGDNKELVIRYWEIGTGKFALGFLEHINILGVTLGISVVAHHLCGEVHKLLRQDGFDVGVE